jgi:hypothetical protein
MSVIVLKQSMTHNPDLGVRIHLVGVEVHVVV